ncbi:MAG: hypothetical protein PUK54_08670 [Firmicutes bacterium]|nr:hypothetical protein [Bacillota bacterium]MDY5856418.1 hypothetical protein [Anaerovoracaceae bacterium]
MKKKDSYEEKTDSWLHHFVFLIPLFIILGIVIYFGFIEPDYLEEGEVSITFFKPLKPMVNSESTDVFRLGIEIPYYDEEGHRLMDEDGVSVKYRYYCCDDQDSMLVHADEFGIEYYRRQGQLPMANDICYLYFTKNGEPCKEGKYEDWAATFTLQGIHDEIPPYNRLYFSCLENSFYEMEKDEFEQAFGLRGEYSKRKL